MNKAKLKSYTLEQEFELAQLEHSRINNGHIDAKTLYKVKAYNISYHTGFMGKELIASGVLLLPDLSHEILGIISFQNGTSFLKNDAPSLKIKRGEILGYEKVASSGYIVLVPDYIGFGTSSHVVHPYYIEDYSASTMLDFYWAANEFLEQNNIPYLNHLYLAGYSEGAYITLSTAKLISNKDNLPWNLQLVSLACGGYNLFGMLASLTQNTGKELKPAYLVYLIKTYQYIYQWSKPLNHFFTENLITLIPSLYDGNHDTEYINQAIGGKVEHIFNAQFYGNLAGNGELELKKALFANTLSQISINCPVRFYHSTDDEVIPFNNTLDFYLNLKHLNPQTDVSLEVIYGANHHETKVPFINKTLLHLSTLHRNNH